MSLEPIEAWRRGLARTPSCLTPDQFTEELSAAQRAHLDGCALCQAEKALFEGFLNGNPSAEEALPVQWIAAETKRRLAPEPKQSWLGALFSKPLGRPWLAGAVAACLVAGIGLIATRPQPLPDGLGTSSETVYRSGSVELVEPVGDVAAAPSLLRWHAVAGAASYEIQILEVDRELLWKSESARDRIEVPASVRARLLAGKTVLWQVTAKDPKGTPLASSPSERFRVKPKNVPTGE
ncbi:MAG: hypothetical protein U0Q16_20950 [Bryobacteraceae bacterium]